jgi:hypothetical protein
MQEDGISTDALAAQAVFRPGACFVSDCISAGVYFICRATNHFVVCHINEFAGVDAETGAVSVASDWPVILMR